MARYAKFFSVGGGAGTNNLQLPVGTVLDTTLRQVQDGLGTGSPLYISTRRVGITSDPSVTTQTSSVIQATTTNANLVIAPNGTGALIADVPDSTPTGGNARGDNAVDLQTYRAGAPEVASGDISVIGGGRGNTASNNYSVVSGGYSNISSGQFSYVGAGTSNTASSNYSTVSGGQSNTASTGTHATVVGGQSNTASGQHSVTGGTGSVASGIAAISFGQSCTAASNRSVAIGSFNTAGAESSIALGNYAQTTLWGQLALSSYFFAAKSDQQQSYLTAAKTASLNSAATTVLSLDGTGVTNLIIPFGTNRLWAVKVVATAFVSVAGGTLVLGDSYMGEFTLLFKRVGGTSSLVGVNAGNIIYDTNMATAAFTFAAGASQDLQITFKAPTTASATTFRCVAKVELVEVAY
jgi:hypothetical protein